MRGLLMSGAGVRAGAAVAAVVAVATALTGCVADSDEADGDVTTPVVMSATDLNGETVDLVVGQVLDIATGDVPVDGYDGEVTDPAVAEFTQGYIQDEAVFNPGVTGLAAGSTTVTLTSESGDPITFTVEVTTAG